MTVTNILSDLAQVNRLLWRKVLVDTSLVVPCQYAVNVSDGFSALSDAWEDALSGLLNDATTGLSEADSICTKVTLHGEVINVIGRIEYEGNEKTNPYCRRIVKLALESEHAQSAL